ncbi:hypothetical protein CEXT_482681, partial [Caerostris extrusa]
RCAEKKVSEKGDACSVDIDIQQALNNPKCSRNLTRLIMYCTGVVIYVS